LSELSFIYDEFLGENTWRADNGIPFNDKYKQMAVAYAKKGMDGIKELFAKCKVKCEKKQADQKSEQDKKNKKIKRILLSDCKPSQNTEL
jgi:hypothetical protein